MYNQHDDAQAFTFTEASKLAVAGEEFSHMVKLMNPDTALRLKIFVQQLPDDIREKTIYGKAVGSLRPKSAKRKT